MRTMQQPKRERAMAASDRLYHLYDPWSFRETGFPPVGARALCGHVRHTDSPDSVSADHPTACVVCTDLAGMR